MKKSRVKRIAITGPESCGKSVLAAQMAEHFGALFVPEYSREYLEKIGTSYTVSDIEKMARGQFEREKLMAERASEWLFCDTDFTVLKIWSEVVFGHCSDWIQEKFVHHRYDLYLLCYPDLVWKPDPLRENPDNRLEIFELYQTALNSINAPVKIVDGIGENRFEKAVNFVQNL